MFWLKNDETAGRIVRTVLWLSWRCDEAVRILCLVLISGEMLLQLREGSRESCAHLCGGSDGSCSAVAAWFTECARPRGGHEDSSRDEEICGVAHNAVRAWDQVHAPVDSGCHKNVCPIARVGNPERKSPMASSGIYRMRSPSMPGVAMKHAGLCLVEA